MFKPTKNLQKAGTAPQMSKRGGYRSNKKAPKQLKHLVPPTHTQKKQLAVKTPKQFMTQPSDRPPQKFSLVKPVFKQRKTFGIDDAELTRRIRNATS